MSTALTVQSLQQDLDILRPDMADVLQACGVPVARIVRTVLWSVDRLPALLQCSRSSVLQAAMGASVLGLETDGVTGQAFLIPFGGRAQLVVGYKGFNTLASRGGWSIDGDVVREADTFEHERIDGTLHIRHKRKIGGDRGRIIAAYAMARHQHMPSLGTLLDVDEIEAVKAKSPGANKRDSPWNDVAVGYPAMALKTAKRRLARSIHSIVRASRKS